MTLFEKLKQLFSRDAQKFTYVAIPRSNVDKPTYPEEPVESGKHYFRLWLSEMFLQKEVDWFSTYHPVAHSLVVLQFGNQKIELPHVAGPSHIKDLDEAHLERVIQLSHPMTPLMPFEGGIVEIVVALVAMKGKDYVGAVTKVLGDLSKTLMVPQLSSALSFAMPIATGIQDLLGGGNSQIHLGVHQSFTGKDGGGANVLRSGYIAVIRADEKKYPKDKLWVAEDRLRFGDSLASSQLLTGVTHMLFRIESRTDRDDWRSLTTISEAFAEALKYLAESDTQKAEDSFRRTLFLVRMSPDLTRAHRVIAAKALQLEFEEARAGGLGAIPVRERTLEKIVARHQTSSVHEVDLDDESLSKLFGF